MSPAEWPQKVAEKCLLFLHGPGVDHRPEKNGKGANNSFKKLFLLKMLIVAVPLTTVFLLVSFEKLEVIEWEKAPICDMFGVHVGQNTANIMQILVCA